MTDTSAATREVELIRDDFHAIRNAVEAKRSLTEEGKATRISAARVAANAGIAKRRRAAERAMVADRHALERRPLRVPSTPIRAMTGDQIAHTASFRDAISRVGMAITLDDLMTCKAWRSPRATNFWHERRWSPDRNAGIPCN